VLEFWDLVDKATHQGQLDLWFAPFEPLERGEPPDHFVLGALAYDTGVE